MVNQGEIEKRLDADFYSINLSKIALKTKDLGELIEFSKETWNQKDLFEETFPYIEISEINIETGSLSEIKEIEIKNAPSRAKMLVRNNDILVSTTRPNRGAIAHLNSLNRVSVASTGFSILREVIDASINKSFLFHILRSDFCLSQMLKHSSGGNYPAITQEALKKIQIPLPPMEVQAHIVELMQDAHTTKQSKEAEATALRQSIDAYVLEQLGITLPTVEKRLFFGVCSSQVEGSRLDPNGYSSFPQKLSKSLHEALYPAKPLQKIIVESFSGDWGEEPFKEEFAHLEKIKVLRNTNFDNKDNLDLSDVAIRSFEKVKVLKKLLQQGDILVEKSGGSPTQPVGRVAHVDKGEESYLFSNFLSVIRLTPSVNTFYIFVFLKVLYRTGLTEYMQNQTTGIKNLLWNDFVDIQIPLPPPPLQNAIAEEVQARLTRAKQLESEAKLALASAKADVERLLFGEPSPSP